MTRYLLVCPYSDGCGADVDLFPNNRDEPACCPYCGYNGENLHIEKIPQEVEA